MLYTIITPLPAANPSTLITVGKFTSFKKLIASFSLLNTEYFAVGILCFLQIFFIKIFEVSSCEDILSGPKVTIFSFFSSSTIPLLSGSSGPITTKSIFCFIQKLTTSILFIGLISKQSANSLIESLPGIQYNFLQIGDFFINIHNACSLPPFPITRTFISDFYFLFYLNFEDIKLN